MFNKFYTGFYNGQSTLNIIQAHTDINANVSKVNMNWN
jgi:hypothetical protein